MNLYTITGDDHVTVVDEDGYEVVHWTQDEWEEVPELVPAIAKAAALAYADPERLISGYIPDGDWEAEREHRDEPAWADEVPPFGRQVQEVELTRHDEQLRCPGCGYQYRTEVTLTGWDDLGHEEGTMDGNCPTCTIETLAMSNVRII